MKKVVYSIKKVRGNSDDKISSIGFLNKKERCYVSAFQKTANDIRELSMTLNSIVSLYSEKKTNTRVT